MYTVLADDFTGANDTGIQFLCKNKNPVVLIDPPGNTLGRYGGIEVLIVDTETRHLDRESAYEKVKKYASMLKGRDVNNFFKKIDSTFRGNVGAEIDGLMDALGYSRSFVIAAAPENGRIVRNGSCIVDGVELVHSEFGKDSLAPVHTSFVPDIIRSQSRREVALVTYDIIRGNGGELKKYIDNLLRMKSEILVFDSLEMADIEKIISAVADVSSRSLFVGSSGLGRAFGKAGAMKKVLPQNLSPKVLFVYGSRKNISVRQIDLLLKSRHSIGGVEIFSENLIADRDREIERVVRRIDACARENDNVILFTVPEKAAAANAVHPSKTEKERILRQARFVAESIGIMACRAIIDTGFRMIFITGGDTALNVMNSLNVKSIELLREIEPGIPLCRVRDTGSLMDLHFITKAGGFGNEDTPVKILDFIGNEAGRLLKRS